jgi:hypothetical protein
MVHVTRTDATPPLQTRVICGLVGVDTYGIRR